MERDGIITEQGCYHPFFDYSFTELLNEYVGILSLLSSCWHLDIFRLSHTSKVVIMFSLSISKTFHIPSKVYHKYILYYMAPIYIMS